MIKKPCLIVYVALKLNNLRKALFDNFNIICPLYRFRESRSKFPKCPKNSSESFVRSTFYSPKSLSPKFSLLKYGVASFKGTLPIFELPLFLGSCYFRNLKSTIKFYVLFGKCYFQNLTVCSDCQRGDVSKFYPRPGDKRTLPQLASFHS